MKSLRQIIDPSEFCQIKNNDKMDDNVLSISCTIYTFSSKQKKGIQNKSSFSIHSSIDNIQTLILLIRTRPHHILKSKAEIKT